MQEMAKGFSFFEEALLLRHGTWTEDSTGRLQELFRMQCSTTTSSMMRKTDPLPRHYWTIFSRGQTELNPARNQSLWHQCQTWVKLKLAWQLLLLMILQLFHLSPPLPSPVSDSSCLFTGRQPCMPAAVLHCHSFQGTVLYALKCFILCVCSFKCIICVKTVLNLLQYSTR